MDITTIVSASAILGVVISAIVQLIKKVIQPKFGDWGVRGFVIVLAILGGLGLYWWQNFAPVWLIAVIPAILSLANTVYTYLIKTVEDKLSK